MRIESDSTELGDRPVTLIQIGEPYPHAGRDPFGSHSHPDLVLFPISSSRWIRACLAPII